MREKFAIKKSTFLLLVTTCLSFLFFLWGVNSWEFSFVGDEWIFYIFAQNFLLHPQFLNLLSFSGVFGSHSPLISMYQAFFMLLFGQNNFAWRLSNIILIFPLSFFFYKWLKLYFPTGVAMLATIFMQCSFYLANFLKIGYDNPLGLAFFVICLYLAALFGKKPSKKLGLLLGGVLGISFYIYFGAAFPLFIWPYFLPVITSLKDAKTRNACIILLATYVIFLVPTILHPDSLKHVLNSLGSASRFGVKDTILYDFFLFYKNHDYFYNHFVVGPYLDSISQIFCIIGTILVIIKLKQRSHLFLLLSYITTIFFIGSATSNFFSPTTRGIFFLPYGFVFAGIGLNVVRQSIQDKAMSFIFCWVLLLGIASLNVYQSQFGVFADSKAGYTGMALITRTLQYAHGAHKQVTIVISSSQYINYYTWMLPYMTQAYGLSDVSYVIVTPDAYTCQSSENAIVLVLQKDTESQEKLQNMQCPTSIHYSLLTPSITYF